MGVNDNDDDDDGDDTDDDDDDDDDDGDDGDSPCLQPGNDGWGGDRLPLAINLSVNWLQKSNPRLFCKSLTAGYKSHFPTVSENSALKI